MNIKNINNNAKKLMEGIFSIAILGGIGYSHQNNVNASIGGDIASDVRTNEEIDQLNGNINYDNEQIGYDKLREMSDSANRRNEENDNNIRRNVAKEHADGYNIPSSDWHSDLKDDVTGNGTVGYNPRSDVDYDHRAPNWLKGYWVSSTYYRDAGNTDQYQEFGIGGNKYGYSSDQNIGENNILFNSVDGIIGIHKINRNKIYCYSKAKDYTGYWKRINRHQYKNQSTPQDQVNNYALKRKHKHNKNRRKKHSHIILDDTKYTRSHFRRTNNKRLLKRSGFHLDPTWHTLSPTIYNNYPPYSKKAYIPKWIKIRNPRGGTLSWDIHYNTIYGYDGHNKWECDTGKEYY